MPDFMPERNSNILPAVLTFIGAAIIVWVLDPPTPDDPKKNIVVTQHHRSSTEKIISPNTTFMYLSKEDSLQQRKIDALSQKESLSDSDNE